MLIVKRIWTCDMEFALYKLIIINYHQLSRHIKEHVKTSNSFYF